MESHVLRCTVSNDTVARRRRGAPALIAWGSSKGTWALASEARVRDKEEGLRQGLCPSPEAQPCLGLGNALWRGRGHGEEAESGMARGEKVL